MKFKFCAIIILFAVVGCKTTQPKEMPMSEEVGSVEEPPVIEKAPEPFEGFYYAVIPTSKTKSLIYAVQFKYDKTAKLLLFRNQSNRPDVFNGKWLKAADEVVILYFPNTQMSSEFFKLRDDGNLSILQKNRKPYAGRLYEQMVLEKIPADALKF